MMREEIAAADANLDEIARLIEAMEYLLDDLWEARQLLSRIDHYLSVMDAQPPQPRRITARLLQIQIAAWRDT
jgi:uncharacterized protein YhdP